MKPSISILLLVVGVGAFFVGRMTAPKALVAQPLPVSAETAAGASRTELPIAFKVRLNTLIEGASKLSSAGKIGLNFADFGSKLADLQGSFDLALTIWPPNVLEKEKNEFKDILVTYRVLHENWKKKINKDSRVSNFDFSDEIIMKLIERNPTLELKKYEATERWKAQTIILASDQNISILMGDASAHIALLQAYILPKL